MNGQINDLKNELYYLLESKKNNDLCYVSVNRDINQVFDELNKILKNKKEDEQEETLLAIINIVRKEIEKDILNCEEIFYSLPIKVKDLKKNNPERLKELASDEKNNRKSVFEKETSVLVGKLYNLFDESSCSRGDLEKYESVCNHKLKDKTSIFGIKDASGKVIGEFNKGMYGSTREKIIDIYKENGFRVSNSERFVDSMSDELLKYRIIGLFVLSRYCVKIEKEWEEGITDSVSCVSKDKYEKVRERAKELGKLIRNEYIKKYNVTPLEEITINIAGDQSVIVEAFPKLKEIIEDEESSMKR